MAKTKSKSDNDDLWRTLISEQASSGLSVASFCKERTLSQNQFYWRKRKLSHPTNAAKNADIPQSDLQSGQSVTDIKDEAGVRDIASSASDHHNLFAPVRVKDDEHASAIATDYSDIGSPIEIALRSGATIRVQRHFDSETLIRVLDCLEDRRC